MRMIQLLGFHKESPDLELSPAEAEQRRRIFWTAFLLDTTSSIKAKQHPALELDNIQVHLPDENLLRGVRDLNSTHAVDNIKIFKLRVQLAIIESRVHRHLLNRTYDRVQGMSTINEISQLRDELTAWRDAVPPAVRPEYHLHPNPASLSSSVTALHLAYYDCVGMIRAAAELYNSEEIRISNIAQHLPSPAMDRLGFFTDNCARAARATLAMTPCLETLPLVEIW
ncbi:hypothetical protein P152DRAFT_455310 [Eremomyces bilateralis CBS 781.70]|uniref:Xylanolytic transcriptional activator regulatory domain-containing protein n=1 Tax=Eremomyces bilateralis CBS 781.70 TaxID=1392243 RepID=A0A6G1GCH1_9PEZI|nr:uncharacterized protein P152DRAFT_455310 [Eremomyces bilateralis CBS 781.70]KAF1815601.1 hypothetical protein P152DRAFT_455310 [Eremomyces bilateralis CBS 781.70]